MAPPPVTTRVYSVGGLDEVIGALTRAGVPVETEECHNRQGSALFEGRGATLHFLVTGSWPDATAYVGERLPQLLADVDEAVRLGVLLTSDVREDPRQRDPQFHVVRARNVDLGRALATLAEVATAPGAGSSIWDDERGEWIPSPYEHDEDRASATHVATLLSDMSGMRIVALDESREAVPLVVVLRNDIGEGFDVEFTSRPFIRRSTERTLVSSLDERRDPNGGRWFVFQHPGELKPSLTVRADDVTIRKVRPNELPVGACHVVKGHLEAVFAAEGLDTEGWDECVRVFLAQPGIPTYREMHTESDDSIEIGHVARSSRASTVASELAEEASASPGGKRWEEEQCLDRLASLGDATVHVLEATDGLVAWRVYLDEPMEAVLAFTGVALPRPGIDDLLADRQHVVAVRTHLSGLTEMQIADREMTKRSRG